jgi:hypothetical protein
VPQRSSDKVTQGELSFCPTYSLLSKKNVNINSVSKLRAGRQGIRFPVTLGTVVPLLPHPDRPWNPPTSVDVNCAWEV